MIELRNVTIARSGRKLFQYFDWKINAGEHWVIRGNNGSGKTILLELVAGLLPPQQETVHYSFLRGEDWETRYSERQKAIRHIPTHAIRTMLRGYHSLFYQQRYYSIEEQDLPKVKDVLREDLGNLEALRLPDTFRIENLLELELIRLSNGQLKKVLILQQLLRSLPKFLLMDYPLEGLDKESRGDLLSFIDHIAAQFGVQIILTDHDHEIPGIINRQLVLEDFRIQRTEIIAKDKLPVSVPAGWMNSPDISGGAPVVEMKGLTIRYGTHTIVDDLHWKIRQGERWALTGKNGSGKTTLFSLIYADHPLAYSQPVYLFGKRRGSGESIWDIKNRISYLGPEQVHFLEAGNITQSARDFLLSQQQANPAHTHELIHFFDAELFMPEPVHSLSSGQLQIMLMIQCFAQRKELLLLDEPFQFLDPPNREKAMNYLNTYLAKDVTLVLITHHEKDVRRWTHRKLTL